MKAEAEMTDVAVPNAQAGPLLRAVAQGGPGDNSRRHLNGQVLMAGGYPGIVGPLDELITELKQALALAQRNEVVKQPNLDEAPPAYRSAVSDYFEAMSKDYHPDGGAPDVKKP